jgi:DNA-binding response OmpR family regulator
MAAHVLVIDDDKDLCETLAEALYEDGYDVIGETDAAKALKLIDEAEPDLILLDVRLPGLDGPTFARRYRERAGAKAPVILISAAEDLARLAADLGAAGYLAKPFALGDLLALVRSHTSP